MQIFEQHQPEKGAKFVLINLDDNVAGGMSMSPNNGENRNSKKELHLNDLRTLGRRLALEVPFKPIPTSVPGLVTEVV